MEWCTEFVSIIGQVDLLIKALQQGQVYIVSDNSFVQPFAMAAFVMENETRVCCVTNRIIVPGIGEEMLAYRGEVSGILASLFLSTTYAHSSIYKWAPSPWAVTAKGHCISPFMKILHDL
jgi:hypothetical protein